MQYADTIPMSKHMDFRARVDALVGADAPAVGYSDHYRRVSLKLANRLLRLYGPRGAKTPRVGYTTRLEVPGFHAVDLANWGGQWEIHAY